MRIRGDARCWTLARVASMSTVAGGRLDVLCDIAVQVALVGAVAAVATAAHPGLPSWLIAAFGGSWMVNMVTSVMAKEKTSFSLLTATSLPVQLIKLTRDYGAILTAIAAVLAVAPVAMPWVMILFTAGNVAFLAASITRAGRRSLHDPGR
ncbi:CDP-alcohol phosphatidyltransferase [Actinoplanes sp. NPDC051475]|uniref:CDP-alcohol phosphatidyltransferase n=1 Tax=Actinoplanes sp. NPDC051475 TaxID=3157225 RepID=UPI00344F5BC4